MKIHSKDISVVVQGPLYGDLYQKCLESIKKVLPDAEIVLSTWVGEGVDKDTSVDILILRMPPKPFLDINGNRNNVALQAVSTYEGIKASSRAYVLKMRVDHFLMDDRLCQSIPSLNSKFTHVSNKIVISNYFIRDCEKVPFLFHVSDLIQFGKKEDLLSLWQGYVPKEDEVTTKTGKPRLGFFGNYCGNTIFTQVPEQTLIIQWLKRLGYLNVDISYPCETRFRLFHLWENVLSNNFHIINAENSGIKFPDRFLRAFLGKNTIIHENKFAQIIENPGAKSRYAKVLINKYFLCFFDWHYIMATGNVFVSYFFPNLGKNIRKKLRRMMGLEHRERDA